MNPKPGPQFDAAEKDRIPYAVIITPDAIKEGIVRIKEQLGKEKSVGQGEEVPRSEMVAWLKAKLGR